MTIKNSKEFDERLAQFSTGVATDIIYKGAIDLELLEYAATQLILDLIGEDDNPMNIDVKREFVQYKAERFMARNELRAELRAIVEGKEQLG